MFSGGGRSSVDAMLLLMREATKCCRFDYYQILQGSDYPIFPMWKIESYLEQHAGKEFIKAHSETASPKNTERGKYVFKWFLDGRNRFCPFRIINKIQTIRVASKHSLLPPPRINLSGGTTIDIYQGWAHFCITDEAVRYCLSFTDNHPEYYAFFKHVYAADESYFHTIIYNSSLVQRTVLMGPIAQNERKFIPTFNLTYFEYPNVVRVFSTRKEYDEVLKNSGCLYFRKVASGLSDELLDYIDSL